jgi:hypothetical protein
MFDSPRRTFDQCAWLAVGIEVDESVHDDGGAGGAAPPPELPATDGPDVASKTG